MTYPPQQLRPHQDHIIALIRRLVFLVRIIILVIIATFFVVRGRLLFLLGLFGRGFPLGLGLLLLWSSLLGL